MTVAQWIYISSSVLSLVILATVAWYARYGGGNSLLEFGRVSKDEQEARELRAIARQQYVYAFWMMLVAGGSAAVILAIALLKAVVFPSGDSAPWVVGAICGVGDTALFGWYVRVWRECRNNLDRFQ